MDSSKTENAGKFVILHHLQTKKVVNEPVGTSSYIFFTFITDGGGGGGGGGGGEGVEGGGNICAFPFAFP